MFDSLQKRFLDSDFQIKITIFPTVPARGPHSLQSYLLTLLYPGGDGNDQFFRSPSVKIFSSGSLNGLPGGEI